MRQIVAAIDRTPTRPIMPAVSERHPTFRLTAVVLLLWFGVVLPTHRIGVLQMPVTGPAGDALAQQLESTAPSCCRVPQSDGERRAPRPATKSCAICWLLAHSIQATPPDLSLPRLAFLQRLPFDQPQDATCASQPLPIAGRAPPVRTASV